MNIFEIPFYYISFHKNLELEQNLRQLGFEHVRHFKAIDGRKKTPRQFLDEDIISIRSYNDLVYGRQQHTGVSSLGTIGCTLSHLELWKLCSEKLPYIIIAEEDLIINEITEKNIRDIQNALNKENGVFISTNFTPGDELLVGLHLYFLTNGAATTLVQKALPIDLQTDCYMGHLNNIGDIFVSGYKIGYQKGHASSTGDKCVKCILPKSILFYIGIILFVLFLAYLCIFTYKKLTHTAKELESCENS